VDAPVPQSPRPHIPTALQNKLVLGTGIDPVAVEQYRRLAATLHDLQADKGVKTVLITSAVPHEGKTLSVVNLALTLSDAYRRRVLLIDADLRRPALHDVLGLPNRRGLHEALLAQNGALPLVQVSPLLAVLPAGQPDPNPIAGLASERMRALLAEGARAFDWVLLDAPPVMLLPDAGLLSKLIDGVVFVIGAGTTPFPMVERAIAELGRDCIIGTVLNRVEEQTIPATGYYHQYYRGQDAT
jgi:capsular exopolysaccharide synthesis family protein